jgi:glutaredoxin
VSIIFRKRAVSVINEGFIMNCARLTAVILFLGAYCCSAAAVEIYKCQDNRGNITFQDRCPPGTTRVGEKDYSTATGTAAPVQPSTPLTLYVVPDCDSCKQVEEFLQIRNIPVTEKNVDKNIDLQNELKKVAGELRVPVLVVKDKPIVGYNRPALLKALTDAGYKTDINKEGGK